MKNSLKKLFLLSLIAAGFASCDLGGDKELNYGATSYVSQFPFAEKTAFFLKDDAVVYDYEVPVELVGGNGLALDKDVNVTYEVDLTKSTAIEGTNFSFANTTKSVVIPAGSVFSTIKLKVNSGTLDDQNPPLLVIKLTQADASGANLVTSGNKGSIAITLQGTCSSNLAKTYDLITTRLGNGVTYNLTDEVIAELSPGKYLTSSTGPYNIRGLVSAGAQLATPTAGFIFNEVCGRIALTQPSQLLGGAYSNIVTQSPAQYAASSVEPETGIITIEYSVWFTNNTVERPYRGVYTPKP